MRNLLSCLLTLGCLLVPSLAAAEEPEPLDPDGESAWDHFEFSMGFLAGYRDYSKTNFAYRSGGGPGAQVLSEPFRREPFDGTMVYGLRYDVRLVASYVRMTAGFDLPFPAFEQGQTNSTQWMGDAPTQVSVQAIRPYELRFGIGAEYPIGPVAPFVDILGGVHWVTAELAVDDAVATYKATSFAFSGRGGLRLHVRDWFFASAAGEVGFVGETKWGAELSVGFAAM